MTNATADCVTTGGAPHFVRTARRWTNRNVQSRPQDVTVTNGVAMGFVTSSWDSPIVAAYKTTSRTVLTVTFATAMRSARVDSVSIMLVHRAFQHARQLAAHRRCLAPTIRAIGT